MKEWLSVAALACSWLAGVVPVYSAELYPSRPIHLIVPFAPGQVTDWLGRFLAEAMTQELGQPVIVENRPGLSGVIGTAHAARQAPDGYTLTISSNGTHSAAPSLYKNVSYEPIDDFTHVSGLMSLPWMLMVRSDFPARNFGEFLAYARTHPGELTVGYGSSSSRLCVHLLRTLGRLDIVDVPYKSLGQTVLDVRSGQLKFTFLDIGSAMAQQQGGALRGLAVTAAARSSVVPDVPAASESLPDYRMVSWLGLAAPRGTDPEIVAKLRKTLEKILSAPDTKRRIAVYGGEIMNMNGERIVELIREENKVWARFAVETGIEKE